MRIVLAVDGSPYTAMATRILKALQLPSTTIITIMTVVPERTFLGGITVDNLFSTTAARDLAHKAHEQKATSLLKEPTEILLATGISIESVVCWGRPAEQIMKKAKDTEADIIVLGAKGTSASTWFPLGSVAQQVMKHADCSVLLVREGPDIIRRVFIATDGSVYSEQVNRLLLDLSLPKKSQVTLLTALQSHTPSLTKALTFDRGTNGQALEKLKEAEERVARSFMNKTKEKFEENGYEASMWVLRGEPAEEILEAANELHPEILALGAKGLTNTKSVLLGSVAERVARFSRYSVLIGRVRK